MEINLIDLDITLYNIIKFDMTLILFIILNYTC